MEKIRIRDPGSGNKIPDPQHWVWGSGIRVPTSGIRKKIYLGSRGLKKTLDPGIRILHTFSFMIFSAHTWAACDPRQAAGECWQSSPRTSAWGRRGGSAPRRAAPGAGACPARTAGACPHTQTLTRCSRSFSVLAAGASDPDLCN
jgi:hypothetical protein